jgi:hypothetical protein
MRKKSRGRYFLELGGGMLFTVILSPRNVGHFEE